jgi:hypothetical protein
MAEKMERGWKKRRERTHGICYSNRCYLVCVVTEERALVVKTDDILRCLVFCLAELLMILSAGVVILQEIVVVAGGTHAFSSTGTDLESIPSPPARCYDMHAEEHHWTTFNLQLINIRYPTVVHAAKDMLLSVLLQLTQ